MSTALVGVLERTKVPRPGSVSSMPMLARDRTASRIVERPTPSVSASSGSMGMREPTSHSPVVICRRR